MKKCPTGQYYCYTDKKCKSIPKGFMVDPEGMLRKENGATIDEEGLRDWFGKSKSKSGKKGWVQVVSGKPCARQPGQKSTPKCVSSAKRASMTDAERKSAQRRKRAADPGQPQKTGAAKPTYVSTDSPRKKKMKEGLNWKDNYVPTEIESVDIIKPDPLQPTKGVGSDLIGEAKDKKGKGSGTKDACYHKVKSRYSVWPSAYASGALVKCRKVGAANWGNSTKKEGFTPAQIAALEEVGVIEINEAGKKCWKGYKKAGTQKLFGKTYNRCVKAGDEVIHDGEQIAEKECLDTVEEAVRIPSKTGNIIAVVLNWRGKGYMIRMFFPSVKVPSRKEIQSSIETVYPGAKVQSYQVSEYEPGQPVLHAEGAAWTKKSGKNPEGGLNEKGRKSYERENPGSDLKAPSKKVGNPRRASFCARMKGMKKKLTSSKTANDPDSRINKSLRKWNC